MSERPLPPLNKIMSAILRCLHLFHRRTSVIAMLIVVAAACLPGSASAKRKSNTQDRAPNNTYFGDFDGDGNHDFLFTRRKWVYTARTDFEVHGLLSQAVDSVADIARVIVGDFSAATGPGRDELCAILSDNWMTCWGVPANSTTLMFLGQGWSPVHTFNEVIVGDYNGDGTDDMLIYTPSNGAIAVHGFNPTTVSLSNLPNFSLGNLAFPCLGMVDSNHDGRWQIRAGDFGSDPNRDDLIIVDRYNGQVCRYEAVTDGMGVDTFWWAFTTNPGVIWTAGEDFAVANIDGDGRDDLVRRNRTMGTYAFHRMEFSNGGLASTVATNAGQLTTEPNAKMMWGHHRGQDGSPRDDLMAHIGWAWVSNNAAVSGGNTYWWSYTQLAVDLEGDQDGDGILALHELGGYDPNGDGFGDEPLHNFGASPFVKDIFIEHDWMAAAPGETVNLRLRPAAINRAVAEFARYGINLHVVDSNEVPWEDWSTGAAFNWASDYDPIKAANFTATRAPFYHYLISAEKYNSGGSSGLAPAPGTDLLVTLGSWAGNGTNDQQAGTLIHELGHNLGLDHGGLDAINNKPNHLSVMSYLYQNRGVRKDGVQQLIYSDVVTAALNEASLLESDGVTITSGGGTSVYRMFYNSAFRNVGRTGAVASIDWNVNGTIESGAVSVDANSDGNAMGSFASSINEYGVLQYTYSGSPIGSASAGATMEELGSADSDGTGEQARTNNGERAPRPKPQTGPLPSIPLDPSLKNRPVHAELTEAEDMELDRRFPAVAPFDYGPFDRPRNNRQELKLDPSKGPARPLSK